MTERTQSMTTDHEMPAQSDSAPDTAANAFEAQRALLQELQWAYKRAVSLEQLELGVESLAQQVRASSESQATALEAMEKRIQSHQRILNTLKDEATNNNLPESVVESVNRISKRTWRMETEVKALASAVSDVSESLRRIEAALGRRGLKGARLEK